MTQGRTDIIHLSRPQGVSMEEQYFDLIQLDHFWSVRRFNVLQKLAGPLLNPGHDFCDIGCGNGLLQKQLERHGILKVDGIDLCLPALQHNVSGSGNLYYYDILEQNPELLGKYDTVFLLDVLEHIDDDRRFLRSAAAHLKKGGHMIINVPARNRTLFAV